MPVSPRRPRLFLALLVFSTLTLIEARPVRAGWELAAELPGYTANGQIYQASVALADDDSAAIAWRRQLNSSVWVARRQGAAGSWVVETFSPDTNLTNP